MNTLNPPANQPAGTRPAVEFTLDQQTIHGFEGETILQAAQRHGVEIPCPHCRR